MTGYKLSRYNMVFERNERHYLWNTLTNALIALDDDGLAYISGFNNGAENDNYFETLRKNGCIVDKRFDELGKVLFDEKATMLNNEPIGLHYTIAPGLGCNYNCPYCFEKDRAIHSSMTETTQKKVCDFIIRAAEDNQNLKQIGITWFGGEPLLYMDAIKSISKQLIDYCQGRNIIYSAGIVTNGRYLSKEIAVELKRLKVSYVQMAIDGMREAYSISKGTVPENFDATINNVVDSADIISITVRINVSKSITEAENLTEYLLKGKGLEGRIKIYIAHVRDYTETNMAIEQQSHRDFLEMEKRYIDSFGNGRSYSLDSLFYTKPRRRCTTCLSVCNPNYCIGPEGELYRCEHHFGQQDHIVGTIESGRFYRFDETSYLKHIHPKCCEECQLLPVCMGGCMNDARKGKPALACEQFKERLIDYLLLDRESKVSDMIISERR